MSRGTPLLVCRGLARAYRRRGGRLEETIPVLSGLDLEVASGESVAIQGESGIGKTTLLNLVGGLDRPDAGEILVDGRPIPDDPDRRAEWRRRHVGFIFQFHGLLGELTAEENVALARIVAGDPRDVALAEARRWLDQVGLGRRIDHYPDELSGGEQQRVAIARALARTPRLVLADEPTGNLDPRTGDRVLDVLFGLQQETGFALVVASHSERLARRCRRILVVEEGRLRPVRTPDADGAAAGADKGIP
ncbi:MAG: ABC transporter ATP-binding protein [Acidobacteriota bacterium]|nr:MAG: ABC transporter ATP-binding protein [Acidobacteriota bacterium]